MPSFSAPTRYALLALIAIFGISAAAHADTLQDFNVSLSFTNGYSATGTLVIDETTASVSAVNLDLFSTRASLLQAFTSLPYNIDQNPIDPNTNFAQVGLAGGSYNIILWLPENSGTDLSAFTGGICTLAGDAGCGGTGNDTQLVDFTEFPPFPSYASSGDITPIAATTPEPPSLILLATGLLAMVGLARRRILPHQPLTDSR